MSPTPHPPPGQAEDLRGLLATLEAAVDRAAEVTLGELHEAIGTRSFGPLLVAVGIAGVTPLAGVPGAPTLLALCAGTACGVAPCSGRLDAAASGAAREPERLKRLRPPGGSPGGRALVQRR